MEKIAVMKDTNRQYDEAFQTCRDIFVKKTRDYGTSWRVLRTISIADQLYIKARRIRTLQETGERRGGGGKKYDENAAAVRAVMQDKNHDYGEAWREMSQESFVDLILMKILRIRQIVV